VHHASARALSRRAAAHRMGDPAHHEPLPDEGSAAAVTIDPDSAWAHIQHALHGEAHSAEALTQAAAISRHDAAHHIAAASKERGWKLLALVGVLAAVALAALLVWLDRRGDDGRLARAIEASDTRVVTSPSGRVGLVTLDDGSRVRLAPDSRLLIPAQFTDRVRGVSVEGAAAFEVAPGKTPAFRVLARDVVAVASGTSFSVRAYPTDPAVMLEVTGGSVTIHNPDESATLASGDAVYIAKGTPPRPATPAERESTGGWVNGMLTIDDTPLRDVLPQLRRWYGMEIGVPDAAMLDRRVTVRASLDSSMQVIHGIEKSTGLQFGYEGRKMVFQAPAAAAPKVAHPAKPARR